MPHTIGRNTNAHIKLPSFWNLNYLLDIEIPGREAGIVLH
jgi:hypothetical protein